MNNETKQKRRIQAIKQKCEKFIDDASKIIGIFENNKVKRDYDKDVKHRPVYAYNNNLEDLNQNLESIKINEVDDRIKSFTVERKFSYPTKKNRSRKPKENIQIHEIHPPLKKGEIRSISIFDMSADKEIERMCEKYKEEQSIYEGYLLELKNNSGMIDHINYYVNLNNIERRIIIHDNVDKVNKSKLFDVNMYEECYIISPPMGISFLYSFYFVDNVCYLSKAYYLVRNKKNEWHLFYGPHQTIKCDGLTEKLFNTVSCEFTVDNIMKYIFEECIVNKQMPSQIFTGIELTINNTIKYKHNNDDELKKLFTDFLKLNMPKGINIEYCSCISLLNNGTFSIDGPCSIFKFKIEEPEFVLNCDNKQYLLTKIDKGKIINFMRQSYVNLMGIYTNTLMKPFLSYENDEFIVNIATNCLIFTKLLHIINNIMSDPPNHLNIEINNVDNFCTSLMIDINNLIMIKEEYVHDEN